MMFQDIRSGRCCHDLAVSNAQQSNASKDTSDPSWTKNNDSRPNIPSCGAGTPLFTALRSDATRSCYPRDR